MKTSLWQRILAKFLAKRQISAAERQYDAELTYTGRTSDAVQNERRDYVAAQLLTVSRLEEIYRDSDTLIRTTTNPKTFFERYDDAKNVLQKMLEYAVPAGIQAGEIEKRLRALEREREQLTLSFIDRSIRAGKRALLKDTMWRYADRLTARSAAYLQSALGQPKRNTGTEYFYCAVAFTPGGESPITTVRRIRLCAEETGCWSRPGRTPRRQSESYSTPAPTEKTPCRFP